MIKKEVYCNLCGSRFDFWDENENYSIHQRCGYGSVYDGLMLDLDICCKCMGELISGCAISPIETDMNEEYIPEEFDED